MPAEERDPDLRQARNVARSRGLAQGLTTPLDRVRRLQTSLQAKAKGRFPERRSSIACRHPAPLGLVSPAFGTGRRAWRRGQRRWWRGSSTGSRAGRTGPAGRPPRPGRPPLPTIEVVETLRFFVREGVQWRELRAAAGRACGSTLRRRLDDWSATALLRRVHAALVRMVRSGPEVASWEVVVDSCSVRAKRGGELTGPNPTDRGKIGTKYHVVASTDGIPLAAVPSAA